MNELYINNINNLITDELSITVHGSTYASDARRGFSFWFDGYNRSNGAIFSIRPTGLKRHTVSVKFGPYASPCIEHINTNASPESYQIAYALIDQLNDKFDVTLDGVPLTNDWNIQKDFNISVTRNVSDQKNLECIIDTTKVVMLPIIAAIMELIGYEDNKETDTEESIEGKLVRSTSLRRERNPRNRMLCLIEHGERCGVCESNPDDFYSGCNSLLEVHHIEPLSETNTPRVYNPRTDLIPLCPNCHRAIHKRVPAYKPEELKEMLR